MSRAAPPAPMEARAADEIPRGGEWQYEPKWDGFRCIASRQGDDVTLASKSGRPLARYFPEVVAALREVRAKRFVLSGATRDFEEAKAWLADGGGRWDGVVAKRLDLAYRAGLRDGMVKVKRMRTADCVVGGWRPLAARPVVGSLLLGLFDDAGFLHHVGFTSTIPEKDRAAWTRELRSLEAPPGFTGRAPGGPSRWSKPGREDAWKPLAWRIVVEVRYDHWSDGRFRHGTTLLRRRPDKAPRQCTFEQVLPRKPTTRRLRDSSRRPRRVGMRRAPAAF